MAVMCRAAGYTGWWWSGRGRCRGSCARSPAGDPPSGRRAGRCAPAGHGRCMSSETTEAEKRAAAAVAAVIVAANGAAASRIVSSKGRHRRRRPPDLAARQLSRTAAARPAASLSGAARSSAPARPAGPPAVLAPRHRRGLARRQRAWGLAPPSSRTSKRANLKLCGGLAPHARGAPRAAARGARAYSRRTQVLLGSLGSLY